MRANARIAETAEQIRKCLPIADERSQFAWFFWHKDRGEFGQPPMRQRGIFVMHAMIRFVQERVSEEMTEPASRHDAASGAVHRVSGEPEMFDVLPPVLEIGRDHRRDEVKPEPIFPDAKGRDRRENRRPDHERQNKLQPDSSSHFPAADQRPGMEENAEENERRIEQADR